MGATKVRRNSEIYPTGSTVSEEVKEGSCVEAEKSRSKLQKATRTDIDEPKGPRIILKVREERASKGRNSAGTLRSGTRVGSLRPRSAFKRVHPVVGACLKRGWERGRQRGDGEGVHGGLQFSSVRFRPGRLKRTLWSSRGVSLLNERGPHSRCRCDDAITHRGKIINNN